MPTIWIVTNSGHDYSVAADHGKVEFLFEERVNIFASDKLVQDIKARLVGSTHHDFMMPSGNAVANCVLFHHLMRLHGLVNLLIYSFKHSVYEVRTIRDSQFKLQELVE